MSQKIESSLVTMITSLQNTLADAEKFDKGNASAGTRVRKALQEISKSCKETRGEILEIRDERKGE